MSAIGLLIALLSVIIAQIWHGGSMKALLDGPAFFIVFGGTLGAATIQTPLPVFIESLKQFLWIFVPPNLHIDQQVAKIDFWGKSARSKGFLSLEAFYEKEENAFTRHGLELIIDGADSEQLRYFLEAQMAVEQEHNELCARFYDALGGYSPTIGILGAVLGLIQAMGSMDDPQKLGEGIAVAFVATIYGVGFANLIYILLHRLRMIHYEYSLFQQLTIEGLIAVANGEGQLQLNRRLSVFQGKGLDGVMANAEKKSPEEAQ